VNISSFHPQFPFFSRTYSEHEIEDHLLIVAGQDSSVTNSKERWDSLDESEKDDVFNLLKHKDVREISLRQHALGINYQEAKRLK